MKTALFPGSFDPFTLGHLDVLQSALRLFDKVIVAVGYNYTKKGFFPLDKRVEIIKDAIKGLDNVEVCTFEGLTIDFCRKVGANCIIRGIRTTTDFELESVVAQANKKMAPEISSIFIPSSHEYSFISSTVVRDVLINGGDARCFLPKNVDITKYLDYLDK
ncbi:MAG: pantetheine-phosphate adenylyltransferase [Bacteroidales bacterium]|jgi:pantetheine-phosphate adenylyltransferase|nr:pantetheine-phosphate adenylyltransferase [Bacteroidales bacterium]